MYATDLGADLNRLVDCVIKLHQVHASVIKHRMTSVTNGCQHGGMEKKNWFLN
jgi:hypothetical protein